MYLLSITINIEDDLKDEWMAWANAKITSLVANKELVNDFRVLKIVKEEPGQGSTYSFQYSIKDIGRIELFEQLYNQQIAAEMHRFYKDKFVEFRTRLEVVNW